MNEGNEFTPIKFTNASSNIDRAEYCSTARAMRVLFKGGRAYEYSGVEPDIVEQMAGADSAGGYFSRVIRSQPKRYACVKIDSCIMLEDGPEDEVGEQSPDEAMQSL